MLNIGEQFLQKGFIHITKQVDNLAPVLVLVPLLHFKSSSFASSLYVGLHGVIRLVSAQRIYPVGKAWLIKNKVVPLQHGSYPTASSHPSRWLIDNFDVANFEKTDLRFDIWLDEKKVQLREDKKDVSVISYGFGEYHTIQDFPIRGRATYLYVRMMAGSSCAIMHREKRLTP